MPIRRWLMYIGRQITLDEESSGTNVRAGPIQQKGARWHEDAK
jgi:hypothetical protein